MFQECDTPAATTHTSSQVRGKAGEEEKGLSPSHLLLGVLWAPRLFYSSSSKPVHLQGLPKTFKEDVCVLVLPKLVKH